jgi:hypothetical protein
MGKIIDMPALQAEIESIESCGIEEVKQIALIAKRNATILNLLWQDIQAQNYKRLWMTLNYRDLLSSDCS